MKYLNDKEAIKNIIHLQLKDMELKINERKMNAFLRLVDDWYFPANTSFKQKTLCVMTALNAFFLGLQVELTK